MKDFLVQALCFILGTAILAAIVIAYAMQPVSVMPGVF